MSSPCNKIRTTKVIKASTPGSENDLEPQGFVIRELKTTAAKKPKLLLVGRLSQSVPISLLKKKNQPRKLQLLLLCELEKMVTEKQVIFAAQQSPALLSLKKPHEK